METDRQPVVSESCQEGQDRSLAVSMATKAQIYFPKKESPLLFLFLFTVHTCVCACVHCVFVNKSPG